jgi:hypothetical protein
MLYRSHRSIQMFEIQESSLLLFKRTTTGLSDGSEFLGLGLIFLLVLWDSEDVRGDLGVHRPEGLRDEDINTKRN